jgi:hypothetical protein
MNPMPPLGSEKESAMDVDGATGVLTCGYACLGVFGNWKHISAFFLELCDEREVKPLIFSCKTQVSKVRSCNIG